MPYLVKERRPIGGREMYLSERPLMSNCVGIWTMNQKEAYAWETHIAAKTACEMLALCNSGTVIYMTEAKMEEKKVGFEDDTKWVVQSNITGDYLASVAVARQLERWVEHIRNAVLFDSIEEARKLTSEFVIGISSRPQAVDIDYIQIDRISHRPIAKKEKHTCRRPAPKETKSPKESEYIVRCLTSNLYFEAHAGFGKSEKWTINTNQAQKFKNATAASSAILKMAHYPKVKIVEVEDLKVVPKELDDTLSDKKNFRINMKHGVGFSSERTFVNVTEVEAVNKMFEAVIEAQKGRFDIGTIEEVGKASTAAKVKVGVEARHHKSM